MNLPLINRRAIPPGASLEMVAAHDGWPLRVFDWPASGAARGSMLVQGGRGDFIEKYIEAFVHWHGCGWNIGAFDWRGQGGSGRFTASRTVGHVADFSVWIDDLAERFAALRKARPGPHVITAHSMGGHLVLRALIERRIAPDAVVLVAPMLGINAGTMPARLGAMVAQAMAMVFSPERPAWRANERPSIGGVSRQKLLTHCADRYADELWWRDENPDLALGPPSWHWLRAAYRSTLDSFAPGALEDLRIPILLLCADHDRLVSPASIREAAARLPDARLVRFGAESAHEILREDDPVRLRALAEIDAFLDERVPKA